MSSGKKVALVTGSTSGIGLACVHALAKRGVNVIITGSREATQVVTILKEIESYNVQVDYVRADLSLKTDIESLWSEVTRLYPDGVDILVNNAACLHFVPTELVSDDEWDRTIAINLSAPFHLTKRSLPAMKKKGWGRIINMSSAAGTVGLANCSGYIATKHGLCGLTKAVALENATCGVTCNAVCPAYTDTPMVRSQTPENKSEVSTKEQDEWKHLQMVAATMPTKKIITSGEVAELVEFLCLSNASSQITGASYLIDGGYTAQ